MEFIVDPSLSDDELNRLVAAASAQIIEYKQGIARAEQLRDMAKLRLIQRQIDACDE